jgi:cytochrome c-type biogenesis protein CcmE
MKPAFRLSGQQIRIGIASVVILGTVGYLVYVAMKSTKLNYFVTIAEMQTMGEKAYRSNLKVEGFVKPATIQQNGPQVKFVLTEFESHNPKAAENPRAIRVTYQGSEPPPDTFKGDAMAVATGTWGHDGVFHATELQAKCASKYAPAAPGQAPSGTPKAPTSMDKRAAAELPANGTTVVATSKHY